MQPEMIADYECVCGEGPLWHPDEKCLYWLDIPQGRIFRYDAARGTHEQILQGDPVGALTLQRDGALLLLMAKTAVCVRRDGRLEPVIPGIPGEEESRFNDAIADPAGRVFTGTIPVGDKPGRLYRLDADGKPTMLLEGIGCTNGLGFTPDRKNMYYTDSTTRNIYIFDYDQKDGRLANQRIFVNIPKTLGVPDGMTVDAQGFVWSAIWDGGCVIRFAPDGREERRINFPAKKTSSVAFGGDDYTDIYVTTAGGKQKLIDGPGAGGLFRVNAGIRGVPEFRSAIKL